MWYDDIIWQYYKYCHKVSDFSCKYEDDFDFLGNLFENIYSEFYKTISIPDIKILSELLKFLIN